MPTRSQGRNGWRRQAQVRAHGQAGRLDELLAGRPRGRLKEESDHNARSAGRPAGRREGQILYRQQRPDLHAGILRGKAFRIQGRQAGLQEEGDRERVPERAKPCPGTQLHRRPGPACRHPHDEVWLRSHPLQVRLMVLGCRLPDRHTDTLPLDVGGMRCHASSIWIV